MKDNLTEAWSRISTSEEEKANIVRGIAQLAIAMGLSPERAGEVFANLDDDTANGIANLFGFPDGRIVKEYGRSLQNSTITII